MHILGIDIGGSGIKGALVDTATGQLVTGRMRIPTPQPSTPDAVVGAIAQIVKHFDYLGPLGVGYPGVVVEGVVHTAANMHKDWVKCDAADVIASATGCMVTVRNDADAAGIAEMAFGAGRNKRGVVMIFTLGTGIGSVMFVNGQIVPNLELGHLYMRNMDVDVEKYASDRVRTKEDLSWKKWGKRLNEYFHFIEFLFSPQVIIIGGGVSKKHEKFFKYIDVSAELVPAALRNEAGIVGAAIAAATAQ